MNKIAVDESSPFPQAPEIYQRMAEQLRDTQTANDVADSRSLFARALNFHDRDLRAVRRHALYCETQSEYRKALEAYRAATLLEPEHPSNWRGIGRCLFELGDEKGSDTMIRIANALSNRTRPLHNAQ